ncbi:MAG TPA: hypothetical protein VL402_13050 [Xanthobacteraceae bacterium]|jgi:hypothetical protein|nr:hypothetical protein [Xanthobacteraceae bacterium]
MRSWMQGGLCALTVLAMTVGAQAQMQKQSKTVRLRGEITNVDGSVVSLKDAKGADVKVKLADKLKVYGVEKTSLSSIKVGDFVGVGAMPQPDGSQKAIQVTIFSEAQRGTGEGFKPWDRPNSTMTNATVATSVSGINGQEMMVKYKDGEKKIIIGPDAVILRYVDGNKSEIKPGAKVAISRAQPTGAGQYAADRINVGVGGYAPH